MTELTPLEYLKHRDKFLKRYNEYTELLVDINIKEKQDVYDEETAEKLREELEYKYKGFTNLYQDNTYCYMCNAMETVDLHIPDTTESTVIYLRDLLETQKRVRGKKTITWEQKIGTVLGIITTLEDTYYAIQVNGSKISFEPIIKKLDLIEEDETAH